MPEQPNPPGKKDARKVKTKNFAPNSKGAKINVDRIITPNYLNKMQPGPARDKAVEIYSRVQPLVYKYNNAQKGAGTEYTPRVQKKPGAFRGISSGTGIQLNEYGKWLKTPPNKASELAQRLEPLPPHMQNKQTWWGAGGETGHSSLYLSPTRIADRIARELLTGRMTPRELISRAVEYYPRGTRFYGYDSEGNQIIKENAPYSLAGLLSQSPGNIRRTKNYFVEMLDTAPTPQGKSPTPIKPPAPPKKQPFKGPYLRPTQAGIKDI